MKSRKIRFVVLLTSLLLAGFVTTSLVSYYVAHDSLSKNIRETTLPLTSDNIYSEIQQDLLRPIFISSLMARDTFVRDWTIAGEKDETAMIRYLKEIQSTYGTETSFFISEVSRKYYHPSGVIKRVSGNDPQDEWYFQARNIPDDYEINVDHDTADATSLTIFINHRVLDYEGNYLGITGVGLKVTAVKRLINTYQTRYGRRIYFVDKEGRVMLTSKKHSKMQTIREMPGLAAHATRILTSPSSSIAYESNDEVIFLNSRLVPEFDWYLLVEQVEDPSEKRLKGVLISNLAICLAICFVVLLLANWTINSYQRRLEEMAMTDKLTGVSNRQMFELMLDQTRKLTKRRKDILSLVMFDIDHFKHVNDTYGHDAGDHVLKSIVKTAQKNVRETDTICRWGGEEFLVLLPSCNVEDAQNVIEKVRHAIETKAIKWNDTALLMTASFGITQIDPMDIDSDIISRVDRAMYKAKANGRNRIEII